MKDRIPQSIDLLCKMRKSDEMMRQETNTIPVVFIYFVKDI
jgi:hypothetical protein